MPMGVINIPALMNRRTHYRYQHDRSAAGCKPTVPAIGRYSGNGSSPVRRALVAPSSHEKPLWLLWRLAARRIISRWSAPVYP